MFGYFGDRITVFGIVTVNVESFVAVQNDTSLFKKGSKLNCKMFSDLRFTYNIIEICC